MYFLYFDPGLGTMIAQATIAIVAGVAVFSKTIMFKLKSFLGLHKKEEDFYDSIDSTEDKENVKENESDIK
jgi:ammonia channel protein AmtB